MNFRPLTTEESASFDTIRWISAFIVLISHFIQIFIYTHNKNLLLGVPSLFSQGAVSIFFALSGFMIGKSISRNIDKNSGVFNAGQYIKSRAERVYPPLILAIFLMLFIYLIFLIFFITVANPDITWRMAFTFKDEFASLLFLNNFFTDTPKLNAPLWSLSYEVWCYILICLFSTKKLPFVVLGLFSLYCLRVTQGHNQFIYYFILWIFGFACSYIHNYGIKKINNLFFIIPIITSSIITIYFARIWLSTQNADMFPRYAVSLGILFLTTSLYLIKLNKFNLSLMRNLSNMSYTLYVTHFPIMLFFYSATEKFIHNIYLSSIVGIIATLFCIYFAIYAAKYVENKKWTRKITC